MDKLIKEIKEVANTGILPNGDVIDTSISIWLEDLLADFSSRFEPPVIPKTLELTEALAEYAHDAWSGWMKYMFEKVIINKDKTVTMPKWAVDRWVFQMNKTYNELPEEMKESDRKEAEKMIAIIGPE